MIDRSGLRALRIFLILDSEEDTLAFAISVQLKKTGNHMNATINHGTSKKSGLGIFWRFFSSVKLTIALLVILAAVSVIGTLIPQREGAIDFAMGMNPRLFQVFMSLNLFDIYHSLLFRIILGFLVMNLVVCSIDRFPVTWKLFSYIPSPDKSRIFQDIPTEQTCILSGNSKHILDRIEEFLHKRYGKVFSKKGDKYSSFFVQTGRFSRFGVYIVHFSILLILAGGLVGSLFGFEGYVNIVEGDKTDKIHVSGSRQQKNLGFEIRCDRFTVSYYKSGMPKEYKSELTFIVNGKDVKRGTLLVNHPLHFRGITFYQASYGTIPGKKIILRAVINGKSFSFPVSLQKSVPLPGNGGELLLEDIRDNLVGIGPAALISILPRHGEKISIWIFKNPALAKSRLPEPMLKSPKFNPSAFRPYTFFLEGVDTVYYTGLQVSKDPGVPIVWAGCVILVTGLFITFFMSHRRIWIRAENHKSGVRVRVAGMANRDPVGLRRHLLKLTDDLRKYVL